MIFALAVGLVEQAELDHNKSPEILQEEYCSVDTNIILNLVESAITV